MRTVTFWRIGSDPEALFGMGSGPSGRIERIPATRFVGSDRAQTLRSFIGCDGHAQTAELRPPPCHNVLWHLMKIANGLAHIHKALPSDVFVLAQPSLSRETMGGHIWISLFYNNPLAAKMVHQLGQVYNESAGGMMQSMQLRDDSRAGVVSTMERRDYVDQCIAGQNLTVDTCWMKLHYLIEPLEMLTFAGTRAERTNGVNDLYVRLPNAGPDSGIPYRPESAYFRFEYRFPSTWLHSPQLAFCYLGLAKLAILNWDSLPELDGLRQAMAHGRISKRSTWAKMLYTRIQDLRKHKLFRITPDLARLLSTLKDVVNAPAPTLPIRVDHEAWNLYNYEGE